MFNPHRKQIASSLIELASKLALFLPLLLIAFDCTFIVNGISLNNQSCNEAARVASVNDPNTAFRQAKSVVDKIMRDWRGKNMISEIRLESVHSKIDSSEFNTSKKYGGPVSGTVTLITVVEIKLMFITWIKNNFSLESSATFPYTYVARPKTDSANSVHLLK